ncbi:uncharacterized protein LAJ45_04237 [Morchella importuna]|uniref:uncharacterized protein n=1 Tax=Morchella importuna TaxID=1174673 RepID=UPI001E8D2022|nr:uncharacterized protein LAJ45_04237 [Morchella importuna]KAH8151615.1 hypothetical protein LAJ45_04237 [Morchella importuna]
MLASRRSTNCALPALPARPLLLLLPLALPRAPPTTARHYATEADLADEYTKWPPNPLPTPYQIFHYNQQTPYSKARYFQLVKLYHPDHARHRNLHITEAVRVERFRLVVAANAILSDPAKRAAYDRFGLGWNVAVAAVQQQRPKWWQEREGHGTSEYGKGGVNDPSRNATWEDWEKYYQRKAAAEGGGKPGGGEGQETLYTSNRAFIVIVAFLASLGGIANISRANTNGHLFLDQTDRNSVKIGRELQRRKQEAVRMGSKDERIQNFLRSRDPVGYGVVDPQEDKVRRLLPPEERCISDDIQKRSVGS